MNKVNAEGTANVVNAALDAGPSRPKLLHISSIAAIGRHPGRRELDETCTWEDSPLNTDYAISKQLAEREAFRGAAEGLDVVVVNPAMVMGAGFWDRGTAALFGKVDRGLHFYTRGSNGIVDVRDVAEAAVLLMERAAEVGAYGQRYILSGENMDFKTFFGIMAEALDRKPPRFEAGPLLLGSAWRWEWIKSRVTGAEPVLTRQSAKIASEPFLFSNRLIRETIGYSFRPIEQTLRDTAALYLASKAEGVPVGTLPINTIEVDAHA
jgi:nucleoside-diphosphate-sugar epimerase